VGARVPSVQDDEEAPRTRTTTTVLRLITRMNIGGPARQAILLTKGLAADYPTLLAAGRPPQVEGELTDPQVRVRYVPLVRPVAPVTDLRCLWVVRKLLHDSEAKLVHTHMAKAGTIGRLAALSGHTRSRPKLVHTFHGHVLEGYFGGAQQRAFLKFERMLARRTDVLIAVSPEVRDELLDLGVGRPAQYRVVPLGFDLAPLLATSSPGGTSGRLRASLGLAVTVPLVGTVGRLVPVKDHATLFSAVAAVPGRHLAVLGDGELRASLEALAHELRIADRTHFTGWWEDIPSALVDLDVVALSSRNEGTPVALI
jgi:glycosyltransferase involved in cell wall biosynthesis